MRRLTQKQKTNKLTTTYCVLLGVKSLYIVMESKWADLIGQPLFIYFERENRQQLSIYDKIDVSIIIELVYIGDF